MAEHSDAPPQWIITLAGSPDPQHFGPFVDEDDALAWGYDHLAETVPPLKKVLRLTIELPAVYADDLDENAALFSEPHPPTAQDRLWLVTEEWFREDVVVTLCSLPGDKCQNHEFEMLPFVGRIVGVETVDNPNFDPALHARSPK